MPNPNGLPSGPSMRRASEITPQLAFQAIQNVLGGRDAYGVAAIDTRVPFPSADQRNKSHAAYFLADLVSRLGTAYDPRHLTWLTIKLLAYLAKSRTRDSWIAGDRHVAVIARALKERPRLLGSNVGFTSLVEAGMARHRSVLTEPASRPVTPRCILWQEPPFSFAETTHPYHLREDGLALRHCAGSLYDRDLLNSLPHRPTPREAPFALVYWRKIQSGQARFLTLMEDGAPRITMQYSCMSGNITELQALSPLSVHDRLLPPLCRALHRLRETDTLMTVRGLPPSDDPYTCLTIDGSYERVTADNRHRVLAGTITAPATVTFPELKFLCSVPNIMLGLQHAPIHLLRRITRIAGTVLHGRGNLRLDQLRHVGGHVCAGHVADVSMPSLITIGGSNYCDRAQTVVQPQLVSIMGSNFCDRATLIHQPALRMVGHSNVLAVSARICQPSLRQACPDLGRS
ncbi:MAG: hypothetical protein AB7E81_11705 [Hyphomicrobiaceae bacterium]